MKKNILYFFIGTVLSTMIILFLLVQFTNMPNERKNGFNRRWLTSAISPLTQAATSAPLTQICGATTSHFFFSVPNPQWLVMMDRELKKTDTIYFPVTPSEILQSAHSFSVDSPDIYLQANNIPALFYGQLDKGKIREVRLASLFTKSVLISPTCMIVRAFDSSQKQQLFQKIDCRTGRVTRGASIIHQRNTDIGFSTDGLLQYDSLTKCLLFVEFYQNRFLCLDTNLNLKYTGKTIDTINTNPVSIQFTKIEGKDLLMPGKPRITVNQLCSVSNGYLFILSGLIADNEKRDDFRKNDVIDIYRIRDGNYTGSFHIPSIAGEKIRSFLVVKDRIIALYNGHAATSKIHFFNY